MYNLVCFALKDGKNEEQLADLERDFSRLDDSPHPLHTMTMTSPFASLVPTTFKPKPVEKPEDRHRYKPSWWRGEEANAKVARAMMGSLPREVGK